MTTHAHIHTLMNAETTYQFEIMNKIKKMIKMCFLILVKKNFILIRHKSVKDVN